MSVIRDIKGFFFVKNDCLLQRVPGLQLVQIDFGCDSEVKAASIALKSHSAW